MADLERVIKKKQTDLDAILPKFHEQRDQEERLDSRYSQLLIYLIVLTS